MTPTGIVFKTEYSTFYIKHKRDLSYNKRYVPVCLDSADIAIGYTALSRCINRDKPCLICIEQYMDSLERDFPEAFGYLDD